MLALREDRHFRARTLAHPSKVVDIDFPFHWFQEVQSLLVKIVAFSSNQVPFHFWTCSLQVLYLRVAVYILLFLVIYLACSKSILHVDRGTTRVKGRLCFRNQFRVSSHDHRLPISYNVFPPEA
jgi:hypothetical protein